MPRLNAKQLRVSQPEGVDVKQVSRLPISLVLDNVLDTFNIGSFFRLADAVSIQKIYLCGQTVTPPNVKIHRASIGTWRWLDWEHHYSTVDLVKKLKKEGCLVVAAEQSQNSLNYTDFKIKTPIALVVGHESTGISKEVLKEVDQTLEIPLLGVNKSLNVLVAASVILYDWVGQLRP
ncbi:MAG: TrmH family RNA methyltransferase [Patescibacteria group bacterium]